MSTIFFRDRNHKGCMRTTRQDLPPPLPASEVPNYRPRGSGNAHPSRWLSLHPNGVGASALDRTPSQKKAAQRRKTKAGRQQGQTTEDEGGDNEGGKEVEMDDTPANPNITSDRGQGRYLVDVSGTMKIVGSLRGNG